MFFEESFGNEVFFTDIMGVFNGPFTITNITRAIIMLKGEGTTNLKVEASEAFHAGNVKIEKGDLIDTGLDVAKGTFAPLGIKVVVKEGRIKAGISCAACHASLDSEGRVIAGIPNSDLNIGLVLAMGTNTAAYFTHTEMNSIYDFIEKSTNEHVENNQPVVLPKKEKLEKFVDDEIAKWPRITNYSENYQI